MPRPGRSGGGLVRGGENVLARKRFKHEKEYGMRFIARGGAGMARTVAMHKFCGVSQRDVMGEPPIPEADGLAQPSISRF
jgi:hypothetical protein